MKQQQKSIEPQGPEKVALRKRLKPSLTEARLAWARAVSIFRRTATAVIMRSDLPVRDH